MAADASRTAAGRRTRTAPLRRESAAGAMRARPLLQSPTYQCARLWGRGRRWCGAYPIADDRRAGREGDTRFRTSSREAWQAADDIAAEHDAALGAVDAGSAACERVAAAPVPACTLRWPG